MTFFIIIFFLSVSLVFWCCCLIDHCVICKYMITVYFADFIYSRFLLDVTTRLVPVVTSACNQNRLAVVQQHQRMIHLYDILFSGYLVSSLQAQSPPP